MIPLQLLCFFRRSLLGCVVLLACASFLHAQPPTGGLVGAVGNVATGRFLEGATVELVGAGRTALADNTGRYFFPSLPPGDYEIVASYTGLTSTRERVHVGAGSLTTKNLDLISDLYRLDKFVVAGDREGNAAAITQQRNADSVKHVVSMDAFGNLANDNAGELLRRLPGMSGL